MCFGVVADGNGVAPCGGGKRALRHGRAVGFVGDGVGGCAVYAAAPLCVCALPECHIACGFGGGRATHGKRVAVAGGGFVACGKRG